MSHEQKIFISHRTIDEPVANLLREFCISIGVSLEVFFCSSLPGNDVREKISVEVKNALQNSCLNIVILSKAYYDSAYCLNEAGILWYSDTPVLPIALPDIQPSDMIGFLGSDYKLRRLDNEDDIAYIVDLLIDTGVLSTPKNTIVHAQTRTLVEKYRGLPSFSTTTTPALSLVGIDKCDKLCTIAPIQQMTLNTHKSGRQLYDTICKLYRTIQEIHIDDIAPVARGASLNTPVNLPSRLKQTITDTAKTLGIVLSPDFFFLGSLSKPFNSISTPFSPPNLFGTKTEIEKHNLLHKLYSVIIDFANWSPVEGIFDDKICLRLALTHSGRTPDEDIDVSLRIPKDTFLPVTELPLPDEATQRYIVKDCVLSDLLAIPGTASYTNYDATTRVSSTNYGYSGSVGLWDTTDYTEEYQEELKEACGYDVLEDGDDFIIKIKFDYLKHNTSAAFPSALLLKKPVVSIPYEIRSQSSADVISGILDIEFDPSLSAQ